MEKLYTVDEVADYLKISTYTVREHIKLYYETDGKEGLKAFKAGRHYRITETALKDYLNKN